MHKMLVTGAAFLAGVAIAAPLVAWSAPDRVQQQEAQFAEADPGMPGMGMGHHGGMMHRMMQLPPRERCEERLARRAGLIAYTVARLNLTPEQKPLSDKLQSQLQASADRERQLCASLKPEGEGTQETVVDRVNRRERFLSARLQGLQQVKPALEELYQALTPEQKAIIDHPLLHR
jgi:LTXXQ motif family protein